MFHWKNCWLRISVLGFIAFLSVSWSCLAGVFVWFLGLRRGWASFPGSPGRSLVQLLHSHLLSIYARQDAFIRICRCNQSSPYCSHCYSGNPADFGAFLLVKTSMYLTFSLVLLVSAPPLFILLWISKLKDLALHCGFRDTNLRTTCVLAPPLTQYLFHHSQHPPLHSGNPLGLSKEKHSQIILSPTHANHLPLLSELPVHLSSTHRCTNLLINLVFTQISLSRVCSWVRFVSQPGFRRDSRWSLCEDITKPRVRSIDPCNKF